jgi:hypothetical protein
MIHVRIVNPPGVTPVLTPLLVPDERDGFVAVHGLALGAEFVEAVVAGCLDEQPGGLPPERKRRARRRPDRSSRPGCPGCRSRGQRLPDPMTMCPKREGMSRSSARASRMAILDTHAVACAGSAGAEAGLLPATSMVYMPVWAISRPEFTAALKAS